METNNTEKIKVSPDFVEAFRLFNVNSQVERIKKLTRKEILLLLILAIDSYSEDSEIVIENFKPFKSELDLIYNLQNDETVTDTDLLSIADETGEKYVDTSNICQLDGTKLPSATTEEEARIIRRDLGISEIFNEE